MTAAAHPIHAPRVLTGVLSWLGIGTLAFDDALAALNPLWTVYRLHGSVVRRTAETPSACTIAIRAGSRFPRMRAGQHVLVTAEIEGVRHRRAYSARWVNEAERTLAITVQRQPYGLVSNWLNEQVAEGDVLELSAPAGDFVLPDAIPPEVLLIAGGSGITPCRAIVDDLHLRAPSTRVTLLYFARSHQERIFAADLERLAARWSNLRYLPVDSQANLPGLSRAANPVLDRSLLDRAHPRWAEVPTYCCGPAPLMDAARRLWREAAAEGRLTFEAFGLGAVARGDGMVAVHQAELTRDGQRQVFAARSNQSLLLAGEASGLNLPHGCRQGVCHECTCQLDSGVVVDLQSGHRIAGEGQNIRLCVSAPVSDVTLSPAS